MIADYQILLRAAICKPRHRNHQHWNWNWNSYYKRDYLQFSITEINIEIKRTATAVIKNELKYFLMLEGNTCIAEPKLQVLPSI